jgi:hypothetical protein
MSILIAKWEMLNLQMGTSSLGVPQRFRWVLFSLFPFYFYFLFFLVSPLLFYFILFLIYFFKTNSSILIS